MRHYLDVLHSRCSRHLQIAAGVSWRHICGAGLLGGIGFTMSIFITNLAFVGYSELVTSSKMAIFLRR
ncbi:Na+/H+ antiporter NhaA [Massilia niastensis]|uniref:Na+/H+ antiporter NhaA n=1 Tax=Massilia niastensis TaxID=544911 RepID=UPI001E5820A5|nr:Na+/H+ antiporter NhaA [Massilia niastensis]